MSFGLWVVLIYSFTSLAFFIFAHSKAMIEKENHNDRVANAIMFIHNVLITLCIIFLLCGR